MGKLCQLLEISRSGYYAWLRGGESARKTANQALLRELVRLHEKYPALGLDSLYHMLKPAFHCSGKGAPADEDRRHPLPAKEGLQSHHQLPPQLSHRAKPAPTPVHFQPPQPSLGGRHHLHPHREGWLYFAIVKDLCTKKIVGYAFSQRIDTQLTLDALNMAVRRERPAPGLIFHSDRGVQYAAAAFRERLDSLGIRQSMSRKGDPYDNAVAENFFSCLKCELVHLRRFDSRRAAQADLFTYIEAFYNTIRPHSSLGWLPPRDFEKRLLDWEAA